MVFKKKFLFLTVSLLALLILVWRNTADNVPELYHSFNSESREGQSLGGHHLAVIVPFRNAFDELLQFVPYMHNFLNSQQIRHTIYVQFDNLRFNRASLINAGYLLSRHDCDYLAMHDVDLLPLNPEVRYTYPASGPFHAIPSELHPDPILKGPNYAGGILLVTKEQFERVNGLSNLFWGWGKEDDEFRERMVEANMTIIRAHVKNTNNENTFIHLHDTSKRKRDRVRLFDQKKRSKQRDRVTGFNNLKFSVVSAHRITINSAPMLYYNVELFCNLDLTPWCESESTDDGFEQGL